MTEALKINWQDVAAACSVMGGIVAMATAYLRLYMAKAIHEMGDQLHDSMRQNFVFKDAHRPEMHEIKKEIARNEAQIEKLSDRLDQVEIRQARNLQ